MSLRVGIPSIGMRSAGTVYQQFEAAAQEAARRNGAALWYVGSDPDGWVYEDSTGTTPATGTDPVGLILDRSYGVGTLGPELVDLPSWTTLAGSATAWSRVGSTLVTSDGTTGTYGQGVLTIGNWYRFTVTVTGGAINVYLGASTFQFDVTGTYSWVGQCTGNTNLAVQNTTVGAKTVSSISCKQLLGYPALQSTAANKPTLELQANGYYGMRFDGVNDLLTTAIQSPTTIGSIIVGGKAGSTTSQPAGYLNGATTGGVWLDGFTGTEDLAQATPILVVINTAVPVIINEAKVITADINGASSRLLKNGVVIGTGTVSATTNATALFGIGGPGATYSGNAYSGLLTLICTSSSALSNADRIAIERFAALLSGASYV